MLPVLIRGLQQNSDKTIRRTCVIIENMCKVVEDPTEAHPLLPKVFPLVTSRLESVSDPDAREVVERAHKQLQTLSASGGRDRLRIMAAFEKTYKKKLDPEMGVFVCDACAALVYCKEDDDAWWDEVMRFVGVGGGHIKAFKREIQGHKYRDSVPGSPKPKHEEPGQIMYKGTFTLAYGTTILLRETPLTLKKGKFYGLLGDNGCGKTTLMRAIAEHRVEGFPKVKAICVEHDIAEKETGGRGREGREIAEKKTDRGHARDACSR